MTDRQRTYHGACLYYKFTNEPKGSGELKIEKEGRNKSQHHSFLSHKLPTTYMAFLMVYTIMILSFRTDRSEQTVQTQIRLLLEEQSDQGLHCLQFRLHLLGALLFGKTILFKL